jgi:hypothetical protein
VSFVRRWWGLEAGACWAEVGRHVTPQKQRVASCGRPQGRRCLSVRRLSVPRTAPSPGMSAGGHTGASGSSHPDLQQRR